MPQRTARENCAVYLLDCEGGGRRAGWLAEEREFYIPNLLTDAGYDPRPEVCAAAEAHAAKLRKAERHIDTALHLAQVLQAAMGDAGDRRAMQVDAVLGIVTKKLGKARAQIDGHDARHTNLFLAYAELRERSSEAT